ncbi:30S ribosomal protein S7 [Flexilinea flocculi]|jgi:small subunit ribosomal protein S7|uniref:Small ribosomal subunit protein uS7 n=1 Tax=Flexilinea flocculi TaxID=1678840 RepID=A0A0S7BJS5_9CHLR|nr:30S ribosomal protein S7 [Flexilinea flocculi]NMB94974.1 30S ribosomal protein S7 [Flexilinea flocculi]GAP40538.1 SSU ribosomal protein S7P [Flexilinea flocculi]
MRRTKPEKRDIIPDVRYNSAVVTNLINRIMRNGKRSTATRMVYEALGNLSQKTGKDGLEVLETALRNVGPVMEVRPRRVGGATYQVPMEVPVNRRQTLAMRWIIDASRSRTGKSFSECLAGELMDAFNNTGSAIRKREETHKMAEANRAFSHYRV